MPQLKHVFTTNALTFMSLSDQISHLSMCILLLSPSKTRDQKKKGATAPYIRQTILIWFTSLNQTSLYLSTMWFGVDPITDTNMCLEDIGLNVKKYDYQYRFNSQHDCGDLYDHSMGTEIFTLTMNKIFTRAPEIMRKVATTSIRSC